MSAPYTYEDSVRAHDAAMYDWLGKIRVDYGDVFGMPRNSVPPLRCFASPQRAFATVVDTLVAQKWIDAPTADQMRQHANDMSVLPLPVLTIERGEPSPDPELSGVPRIFQSTFWNAGTQKWTSHQWPGHYRTEYTVTVWSNKRYTDAFLREWLYGELGKIGMGESEVLVEVKHKEPFGTWKQACRFTGSSDLSDLEGEAQRYIRTAFTFSLRTWIFKPANPVESILLDRIGQVVEQDRGGGVTDPLEEYGNVGLSSLNMFKYPVADGLIPTLWPKGGTATVQRATVVPPERNPIPGLEMTLTGSSDWVELLARPVLLDGSGSHSILSVAFEYKSDLDVEAQMFQVVPATDETRSIHRFTLPAAPRWKKVHFFTITKQPVFALRLVGIGANPVAGVNIYGLDVRHFNTLSSEPDPTVIDTGPAWDFVWSSLASRPFLVIGVLDGATGSGQVEVKNDFGTPDFTTLHVIDSAVNVGFAALTQPRSSSIVATVPKTLSLALIRAQRYDGPYKGHEI